jgi:hypothetical protein
MRRYQLTPKQVVEVNKIKRELREGKTRLATDAEVKRLKKQTAK